jgi:hypothetical protein
MLGIVVALGGAYFAGKEVQTATGSVEFMKKIRFRGSAWFLVCLLGVLIAIHALWPFASIIRSNQDGVCSLITGPMSLSEVRRRRRLARATT